MKGTRRALTIVAFTALVGCSSQLTPASTPTSVDVTLRLYGTSATAALMQDISTAYRQRHPGITLDYQFSNDASALSRLLAGEMPYIFSSHLATPGLWAAPIGQDGIAIIVHPSTAVSEISIEQLRLLYQGFITNWQEVGGSNLPVTVLSREDGSGTRAEFERMVMGPRRTTATAQVVPSTLAMATRVTELPGSIGYVSMHAATEGVQTVAVGGVLPTRETVESSTYPLRSTLFVIGLQEPQSHYRALVAWIQGPEGQEVVRQRYAALP